MNYERKLRFHFFSNIPNSITTVRVLLIPLIFWSYDCGAKELSFALAFLSISSDFFDGYLARRLNQESLFGAIWDPIADKFIALALYGMIAYYGLAPWWLIAAIYFRNISQLLCLPILSLWLKRKFGAKPKLFPKLATGVMFSYALFPLYCSDFISEVVASLIMISIAFAETWIAVTYWPRLIQIAQGKHDTFE